MAKEPEIIIHEHYGFPIHVTRMVGGAIAAWALISVYPEFLCGYCLNPLVISPIQRPGCRICNVDLANHEILKKRAELIHIYTNPKYRSQGHAGSIIEKIKTQCDRLITSIESTPGGTALCKKHGMVELNNILQWHRLPKNLN